MTVFRCHYRPIDDGPDTVDGKTLFDFLEGFWLDSDFEFTKGSDCKYWISPSSIHYIEKINEQAS